jgi:hypothetical protein
MSPAPYRAFGGHLHFGEVPAPNTVITGDCIEVMAAMPAASVDMVLTDPPYVCDYRDRSGRTVANDNRTDWLEPAFAEIARVMKPDTLCISFYGWTAVDSFMAAWRAAGLRPVAHLVFCKDYASRSGYFQARHETPTSLPRAALPCPLNLSPTCPVGSIPATASTPRKSPWRCLSRWCAPIAPKADWSLIRFAAPALASWPPRRPVVVILASSWTTDMRTPHGAA